MAKKTVADIDVKGTRLLVRVDFNVPLDKNQDITDDRRIRGALPTIRRILDGGGRAICMSHLGRPKGEPNPTYSLAPAAGRLGELLGRQVPIAPDCVGPRVAERVDGLQDGQCCLLENLRYHKAEEIKLTAEGFAGGTPAYLAPEMVAGSPGWATRAVTSRQFSPSLRAVQVPPPSGEW